MQGRIPNVNSIERRLYQYRKSNLDFLSEVKSKILESQRRSDYNEVKGQR